jgi:hypothetical protein
MDDQELNNIRVELVTRPLAKIKNPSLKMVERTRLDLEEYLSNFYIGDVVEFIDDDATCWLKYSLQSQTSMFSATGVLVEVTDTLEPDGKQYTFKIFHAVTHEFKYEFYSVDKNKKFSAINPPNKKITRKREWGFPTIKFFTSAIQHYPYFLSIRKISGS